MSYASGKTVAIVSPGSRALWTPERYAYQRDMSAGDERCGTKYPRLKESQ